MKATKHIRAPSSAGSTPEGLLDAFSAADAALANEAIAAVTARMKDPTHYRSMAELLADVIDAYGALDDAAMIAVGGGTEGNRSSAPRASADGALVTSGRDNRPSHLRILHHRRIQRSSEVAARARGFRRVSTKTASPQWAFVKST